ncbi:MAG TPA: hypothetical protein VFU01_02145 [Gemmatimonadaceae bacterium]|nr:hypothetical protein [Gemmatimonadaceae bacterium]
MRLAAALLLMVCEVTHAQVVTESPAPFDSAGRIMTITPPLAARIALSPDVWPVTGDYEEARLYSSSGGDYILAVRRRGGAIERYTITPDTREALRVAVTRGMAVSGRPVSEEQPEIISEPARGAFVRNQMLIAALIYGPAAATFPEKGSERTAAYLLVTGGTFFALMAASKNIGVTRAQNHLATDGAYRGSFIARGLAFAFDVDEDEEDAWAASALLGGILGSLVGFQLGRGYTDSEARASTFGSTTLAATTAGMLGALGAFEGDDGGDRAAVGAIVAAGLLGYPLGVRYPRRASYRVTAGDVMVLLPAGLVGAGLAATPVANSDDRAVGALITAGYLTGVLVGDRLLVRRYDFTESEARLTQLGTLAGALMGLGVAVMTDPSDPVAIGLIAAGGLGGLTLTVGIADPQRGGARTGMRFAPRGRREARVELDPMSLANALARVRGQHSLLRVRF